MQEKILIIDDDKKLTKLLEEFLGSFNYDLAVKHKPEEGIEFCRIANLLTERRQLQK